MTRLLHRTACTNKAPSRLGTLSIFISLSISLYSSVAFAEEPLRRFDWYTLEELTALQPSYVQQLSETKRRQLSTCGGTFWEPPRENLGLQATIPGSILGSAESYEFEGEKVAKLEGNVILQQGSIQARSDYLTIDFPTHMANMESNIQFRDQDLLLTGERADLNLNTHEANFTAAYYTLHGQHIRGDAVTLASHPPHRMSIYEGIYTGCQPGSSDWYFKGQEITLDQSTGWGTAKHMALHIKHVPVFYMPYFRFPIDDQRHTGFLYPSFNSLSEPDLSIPFYINLAPNYDMTLTPRYIGDRGTLLQTEFRFLSPLLGLGQINLAYLPEDASFGDEERKSARWQEEAVWKRYWHAEADINYVSDADYLDDFGTDLSTISDSHLVREVQLNYLRTNWSLGLRAQSWQTIDEAVADSDLPYRRLPEANFTHYHSFDFETSNAISLDWNNFAQLVYFEQPLSSDTALNPSYATRLHYETQLSLPMRWIWGFAKPSVNVYATQYQLGSANSTSNTLSSPASHLINDQQDRLLGSVSLDTGLFFERPIEWGDNNASVTQTLEPRLFLLYVPEKDQSDLPVLDTSELTFSMSQLFRNNRFSGYDRIGDARQLSTALTTRFIDDSNGLEFGRASIGQIFYFEDRTVELGTDNSVIPSETLSRSSSNIVAETELHWGSFWSSRFDLEWDATDNRIQQSQYQLNYIVSERELYHIGYRFRQAINETEEEISQYDISVIHPYSDHWDIIAAWNFDLKRDQTLEQLTGVSYTSCCWRTSLVYRRRIEDTNISTEEPSTKYSLMLEFELIGLGKLGGQLQKIMERTIFGYEELVNTP